MNEKHNRIAAALTVSAVLLVAVLVIVLVYQLITIAVIAPQRDNLRAEIEYYEQLVEDSEDELEWLQSKDYLRWLAIQSGYGWQLKPQ